MSDETKTKGKELAEVKQPGQDVSVYDPGADAGAGMEDVKREEFAIPFLYVLDAKSPQCSPVTAGGVPGAKAGMLFNTATAELYDGEKGAGFLPVHRAHNYGEWLKRNEDGSGGGFIGIRAEDDPLVLELRAKHGKFGKLPTAEGHELVEAYYLYGLIFDWDPAHTLTKAMELAQMGGAVLAPFKSTGIPAYQMFMGKAKGIKYPNGKMDGMGRPILVEPPIWAHAWRIGTQYKPTKKQGQSGWYIPRLWMTTTQTRESLIPQHHPLYIQARELYVSIKAGQVVVKHEESGTNAREPGDDEIPM